MTKSNLQLLKNYFPSITTKQLDLYDQAVLLYIEWNDKINVVSRKDIDLVVERHILHSLAIGKFVSFNKGASILDIGTGGGFPGIPLAILFPDVHFHLIDAIGKKITVVNEICKELKLDNVIAEQKRAERIKEKYDFVTCRAVARLNKLTPWIKNNIKTQSNHALLNGLLTLKGGDLTEEIEEIPQKVTTYELTEVYEESFFQTKKMLHVVF